MNVDMSSSSFCRIVAGIYSSHGFLQYVAKIHKIHRWLGNQRDSQGSSEVLDEQDWKP